MFLKNRNIISKIKRSKVTDYAALTMDFKISDTNNGKKSLIYDGFIYRIDGVLKCGDI